MGFALESKAKETAQLSDRIGRDGKVWTQGVLEKEFVVPLCRQFSSVPSNKNTPRSLRNIQGVDSSYQVQTSVTLEGVLLEALAYIVYIRERYYKFLVRTFTEAIKYFKLKVDEQRGS